MVVISLSLSQLQVKGNITKFPKANLWYSTKLLQWHDIMKKVELLHNIVYLKVTFTKLKFLSFVQEVILDVKLIQDKYINTDKTTLSIKCWNNNFIIRITNDHQWNIYKKESRLHIWNIVVQSTWYKKLFQSKQKYIGETNKQNLGNVKNTWTNAKDINQNSSPPYQTYTPTVILTHLPLVPHICQ